MNSDYVFLIEKEIIWADMLKDVLNDRAIPFLTENKLGVAMALKVGPMMERVRFYVSSEYLEQASEIVTTLFSNEYAENTSEYPSEK